MQYFYLITHLQLDFNEFGDGFRAEKVDKVFLQKEQAIKWGRKYATKTKRKVNLYRQPMASTGQMELMDIEILPFKAHTSM